jgi:putative ABC transport system permease protein
MLPTRFCLSWLHLTHDPWRCAIRVAGITFAVFLMFAQRGFRNGLLDAQVELLSRLDGQIVLVSPARYALNIPQRFPRARLAEAGAVPGVERAAPLYLEYGALWKTPPGAAPDQEKDDASNEHPIRILAFDPADRVLDLPDLLSIQGRLRQPDAILLDRQYRSADYGRIENSASVELAGHRVHLVGSFTLGTDFTTAGTVAMSDTTYASCFADGQAGSPLDQVDLGVVRLQPGADVGAVRDRLARLFEGDVSVCTREEYVAQERRYWQQSTPMGFIFGLGMGIGFIVGAAICYQILATDVMDHLAEFATLKAIGHRDRYLRFVVLQEGLLLGVLGFVPGVAASELLYWGVARWIGWPMRLTVGECTLVLAATLAMCSLSGLLALRKVQQADPAEVF